MRAVPVRRRGAATWLVAGSSRPYIPRVMDIKLHRPRGTCSVTGRPLTPGEGFYSALVRGPDGLERIDVSGAAWKGPPEAALAVWRSVFPAGDNAGPTLAPIDVLLDLFEELEGRPDDAALRYLLALQLVRRRVLKIVEASTDASPADAAAPAVLVLACRRRAREYCVAVEEPAITAVAAVGERLTALLWSGEAA
jgi:hypothetical protein